MLASSALRSSPPASGCRAAKVRSARRSAVAVQGWAVLRRGMAGQGNAVVVAQRAGKAVPVSGEFGVQVGGDRPARAAAASAALVARRR